MPLHDWTRVPAGLYHHFHQRWGMSIADGLNSGVLPKGYDALVEQRAGFREGDVLAIESRRRRNDRTAPSGGAAVLERPRTRFAYRSDETFYAGKANRIVVKHYLGRTVAVIEIVSPGNKDRRSAARDFVEKTMEFLRAGVHVLIVDPFPPSPRDPLGMHKLLWDEIKEEPFAFPLGHDRLAASYESAPERASFVETFGVGEALPDMPLFIDLGEHVPAPLEAAYRAAWDGCPASLRDAVETGVLPSFDEDDGPAP